MSDGISDMYYDMREGEINRIFLNTFAKYLLNKKEVDDDLIKCAMNASYLSRDLLGDFGRYIKDWPGMDKEIEICKKKLIKCMDKLYKGDTKEWALFIKIWFRENTSGSDFKKIIDISPFKGCEVSLIARSCGTINQGAGMGSTLWEKAKEELGNKWEEWDGYGLAVYKMEDIKIIPMPKEKREDWG